MVSGQKVKIKLWCYICITSLVGGCINEVIYDNVDKVTQVLRLFFF